MAGVEKTAEEMDAILAERRKSWKPRENKNKGALRFFQELATDASHGAYLSYDEKERNE